MQKFLLTLLVFIMGIPVVSAAENISRRDGFLLLWEGISRSADETREKPFADVTEESKGFTEITYAKARGLIDDGEKFLPDESLTLGDALLWLFRTRNVDDLDAMTAETLPTILAKYPIADRTASMSEPVGTTEKLLTVANKLDTLLAEEVHEVSLYSEKFQGKGTAFGESFDMNALTAAHRTFPANTLVKVTNVDNGKSVIVRINDRGPYVDGRDMDLSLAAFTTIAPRSQGVGHARFQRLGDASLVDACTGETRRYQKRITRDVRFHRGVPLKSAVGDPLVLGANRPFVVRDVTYPDGTVERFEDWVLPEETFTLSASMPGTYIFRFSSGTGRTREMSMEMWQCSSGQ